MIKSNTKLSDLTKKELLGLIYWNLDQVKGDNHPVHCNTCAKNFNGDFVTLGKDIVTSVGYLCEECHEM